MRIWLVALLAVGCKGKSEPHREARPEPVVVDAASPPLETAPPPHEPRFDVVATRNHDPHGNFGAMSVYDVGDRVIVTSARSFAVAIGDGPLVPEPKLANGLEESDSGWQYKVYALGGTWPNLFAIYGSMPDARAVHFELPLMRFGGERWSVASNEKGIMPVAIEPFGAGKTLVLGWSTGDENGVPAGGSLPIWETFDGAGVHPAPIKSAINARVVTEATLDGHLFVFGLKSAGIWLAHYKVDGPKPILLGEHALPRTQGCSQKALIEAAPILELFVGKGGVAFVSVAYATDGCKELKPGVYQDGEKGLALVTLPLSNTQIIGAGQGGTLWVNSIDPDGLFRVREGKAEAVPLPTYRGAKCNATRVLERAADPWMLGYCMTDGPAQEILFRFGRRSQKPITL